MKRKRKIITATLLFVPMLFMTVHAAEAETYFDVDSQLEASGVNELYDVLPDDTANYLELSGLDDVNYNSFTHLNAGKFINSIINMAENEIRSPLAAAAVILGLLVFATVVKGGEQTLDSPMSSSFANVMSAAVGVSLVIPFMGLIDEMAEVVKTACVFTEAFAPIFIGILLANGQTLLSAGYSSFLFGAIEVTTVCVEEVLVPVLRVFMAISCICAISPSVKIDGFTEFIEKNAKWLLSFLAVILSSILGISGVISASADNIASRTAKFIISGSVPVVGGAVSDAYLSIKSGMALLRSSVGAFGIIAVVYIYLPIIIRTALWGMVTEFSVAVCEVLQLDTVKKLLKSVSGMISLMLGILIFSLFILTLAGIIVIMQKST